MKAPRHIRFLKWTALLAGCAAVAATSAQAGGPPPDPGWAGLPHCTVPNIQGKQLASAKKSLKRSLCGSMAPIRKRSSAARNTVLVAVPSAGTILAPGTKVLLVVSK